MSNNLALALLDALGIPADNVTRVNLLMAPKEGNLLQITVADWNEDNSEFITTVKEYTLNPLRL